LKDLHIIQIWI